MTNNQSKIEKGVFGKVHSAYNILLSQDIYLLNVNANERSITHKLAEYLRVEFPDWNVDCEYNRNLGNVKKLDSFKKDICSDDTDAVTVYPDIIIHHRGTNDNLVVIEAKKSNFSGKDNDDEKLEAYKNDLGYKFAYKIIFPVGEDIEIDDLSKYIQEK